MNEINPFQNCLSPSLVAQLVRALSSHQKGCGLDSGQGTCVAVGSLVGMHTAEGEGKGTINVSFPHQSFSLKI